MKYAEPEAFTLEKSFTTLLPWWGNFNESYPLNKQTDDKMIQNYLNRFYLFPLTEITVNNSTEDIPKLINERYQTILSAAYSAGITVATIIKGEKGKINLNLAFVNENGSNFNPEYFQSILNGILPGKMIELNDKIELSSLVTNLKYGGIVTGIPALKNEDEKQRFNISSVVRSMYGREYLLIIMANPVNRTLMCQPFEKLLNIRDTCHALSKSTVGEEKGTGRALTKNEQFITGTSETQGDSTGGYAGAFFGIGGGVNYSHNWSNTTSESKSTGKAEMNSENNSQSLSVEKQNGYAKELEKIASHYVDRMIQGFNTGYWETTITFAAKDEISCDILGGSFIGELSKPSDKLYPPRVYSSALETNKLLFLPIIDSTNPIFPKSLASYLTSFELAQLASPPTESLPGYEIKKMPTLALTDIPNDGEVVLGKIADYGTLIEGSLITLSRKDLNKHLFVCGLTGSGKSTTMKHILKSISKCKTPIPFLVLESAKKDYRQMLHDDLYKNEKETRLNIFTVGDATVSPISFNPFYIQQGVHPLVHIDFLKAIFNASFSLYGPMPHIVEKCLHSIYLKRGWNLTTGIHPNFLDSSGEIDENIFNTAEHFYCYPTLMDLKEEVDNYVKHELEYKGELRDNIRTAIVTRLESLCIGAKGLMFNTYDFFPLEKLLNTNTILEMENLADDDDKAFFVGLMLVLISEYRQRTNPAINPGNNNKGLQHLLVIEEAHRLLKNVSTERSSEMVGNPKGKAVEVFCNVISEMRSLGQGVAVVEQIPSKISPDVIKNSNTKIVHRLVAKDDQSLLACSLSITDNDALYMNRLKTGYALCHKEGMELPVECLVFDDVECRAVSDDKIKRLSEELRIKIKLEPLHILEAYELSGFLKSEGKEFAVKFLNSLVAIPSENLAKLVDLFNKEICKIIIIKNINISINDEILSDYLVKCIFELLCKGIYCKKPKFPIDFKKTLKDAIKTKNYKLHKAVLAKLSEFWKVSESKLFIDDVVENLSIKYLASKNIPTTVENIRKTVSSYFLIPEENAVTQITKRILIRVGGNND